MGEVYLWRIGLRRYGADGYKHRWLSADPSEAEHFEQFGPYDVRIVSCEVDDG